MQKSLPHVGFVLLVRDVGGVEKRFLQIIHHIHQQGGEVTLLTSRRSLNNLKKAGVSLQNSIPVLLHKETKIEALLEHTREFIWKRFARFWLAQKLLNLLTRICATFWQDISALQHCDVVHLPHPWSVYADPNPKQPLFLAMVGTHTSYLDNHAHINSLLNHSAEVFLDILTPTQANYFATQFPRLKVQHRLFLSPGSCVVKKPESFVPKKPKVVFAGRFDEEKSPLLFLEVIRHWNKESSPQWLMLGAGPLEAEIRKIIDDEKLPVEIRWSENVYTDLEDAMVFVSLQKHTNYPSQVVLDAMQAKCAVIATDVGDTKEFVTENTGVLVPADHNAIQTEIHHLLANPEICQQKGEAGRQLFLQKHTMECFIAYLFDSWTSAIQQTKK